MLKTTDELPLYLFDKGFAQRIPELAADYTVPEFFAPDRDMFAQLPEECRPDHRWLIIGPERSGSSWHIDPNATSAWNAVIQGAKKWVLCPPHRPPPGVTPSSDGASIVTPISLYEWFRVFYSTLKGPEYRDAPPADVPRETVLRAGELLFVPRGWWHTALNVEHTIALTQVISCRLLED